MRPQSPENSCLIVVPRADSTPVLSLSFSSTASNEARDCSRRAALICARMAFWRAPSAAASRSLAPAWSTSRCFARVTSSSALDARIAASAAPNLVSTALTFSA